MSVMNDLWFMKHGEDIINPFVPKKVSDGLISYGVSSYGYDARLSNVFKVFTDIHSGTIDPKSFDKKNFIDIEVRDYYTVPPHSFTLASTLEYFKIPKDFLVICIGKSTYARCGIITNVTPLEPEWEGNVTIEISNTSPLPVKIYANEGICQFIFIQGIAECQNSYLSGKGKYMYQTGITLPKV